ncbi:hypothetical protein RHO15_03490 [Utexia brackfieldae]
MPLTETAIRQVKPKAKLTPSVILTTCSCLLPRMAPGAGTAVSHGKARKPRFPSAPIPP